MSAHPDPPIRSTDVDLREQVGALRATGWSPKAIARALGVRPAAVEPLVRSLAAASAATRPEPAVVGCWVSPGWSRGLGVDGRPGWPDGDASPDAVSGLSGVVVARAQRHSGQVSVCGYLVDGYCLEVTDALGPRAMDRSRLEAFVAVFFHAFGAPPVTALIELARELVLGAEAYARTLGFEPHPDVVPAAAHLGTPDPAGLIRFGQQGKPFFMQGPYDDAPRVLRTPEASVGPGNFDFVVTAGPRAALRSLPLQPSSSRSIGATPAPGPGGPRRGAGTLRGR